MKHGTPDKTEQFTGDTGGPAYSEDGVDLTLIRWMLSFTPAERLTVLQNNIRSLKILTDAAGNS